MLELFKMAIDKPLNAIVVVLCIVVFALNTELTTIGKAVAGINKQQETNTYFNREVLSMSKQLSRIDANTKFTKEKQEDLINITNAIIEDHNKLHRE